MCDREEVKLNANWIWKKQSHYNLYNQTVIARKAFKLSSIERAVLRITADSAYRLFINDQWVSDGPCRAWPEHYQYDVIDVTSYLHIGDNEIRIIGKYWGVGTFHQVPKQAGLLAQLDIESNSSQSLSIITDDTWLVADAKAWLQNTPKVSIQMEPQEYYDARLEAELTFEPAAVLFRAGEGPWQDLHPRDVALLTKEPTNFHSFREANLVRRRKDLHLCLPAARLAHPTLIEANHSVLQAGGIATILELEEAATLQFTTEGLTVWIDGEPRAEGPVALDGGAHSMVAFVTEVIGHRKEKALRLIDPPACVHLVNPLDPEQDNPWCWVAFPEFDYAGDDLRWFRHGLPEPLEEQLGAYLEQINELGVAARDPATLRSVLEERGRCYPRGQMFVEDTHWLFLQREVIGNAAALVSNPAGLMYDNAEVTTVVPSPDGDVELVYDLGEQQVGYFDFELFAEAGVMVDIYEVEYIDAEGRVQHTYGNRNGMRYITRPGLNRFTSTKRRSGRYIFITLRNQHAPVHLRLVRVIASTYPVAEIGDFRCSDSTLTQIWRISQHTLKLCMEDTFTDCPLYEQTLWVGDARNEAAFAYPTFGALDIGRRCARLAAQSLERYPIVGSQVPSSWDTLLPAWSFLWGISIWDYYAFTGDLAFLREMWPYVIQNLENSAALRDPESGLFAGPFWNMFDWSGIDDEHEIVLHNSMLLVGAIDAAQKCADVLKDEARAAWLADLRADLRASINRLWDPEKRAYPDSVHEDGSPSECTSQHTSFLALLYDIVPEEHAADVLENLVNPPEGMTRVGSPFAMMYAYEALEKAHRFNEIIESIYDAYTPMLEAEATTVWEVFPSSQARPGGFPTRSHCHGWSSAPLYFLNRILLGIRPTDGDGTVYDISPWIYKGLTWAKGSVATIRGALHVSWQVQPQAVVIQVDAPPGLQVRLIPNTSHRGRDVTFKVKRSQSSFPLDS